MYLYTLKQHFLQAFNSCSVVNRFKKNVSLHVETTVMPQYRRRGRLWIALKKMYLYTLKQHWIVKSAAVYVVNRFKKNVSLHVETTHFSSNSRSLCCESL